MWGIEVEHWTEEHICISDTTLESYTISITEPSIRSFKKKIAEFPVKSKWFNLSHKGSFSLIGIKLKFAFVFKHGQFSVLIPYCTIIADILFIDYC